MTLLHDTLAEITGLDQAAMDATRDRILTLTMPKWALGRLCDLAVHLAGISGKTPPPVSRRAIVVMAGDHGVVAEGVSLQESVVTQQMVANMTRGGAGVNVLGAMNRAKVFLADFGMLDRDEELVRSGLVIDKNVGKGTANLAKVPAMSREDAVRSIENGIALAHALADDYDVFGTGEMGIGNTTPATAMASVFTGQPVAALTGPGAGIGPEKMAHKVRVIEGAIDLHRPDPTDGLDVLSKVGGYEIGGIAGLVLGGASRRKPVLVDGFISSAGAMLAKALCPAVGPYLLLSHASAEPGHCLMCDWLGVNPILNLDMRLGEGTGAAMALNVVDGAVTMLTEMATFASAGVHVLPEK